MLVMNKPIQVAAQMTYMNCSHTFIFENLILGIELL